MACGYDCTARNEAIAEAQTAVEKAQKNVDTLKKCIETYEKDIVMIEDTLQGLVDAKEALESANQEIIKAGTINGDNTAKAINITLDSSSGITLTGDSYITSLNNDVSYRYIIILLAFASIEFCNASIIGCKGFAFALNCFKAFLVFDISKSFIQKK